MKKNIGIFLLCILVIIPVVVFVIQLVKPLPKKISYQSERRRGNFEFLYDLTYSDLNGNKKVEQNIFKEVFNAIDSAEKFLILDFFLFSDDYDKEKYDFMELSNELAEKIIEKKNSNPQVKIVLITDPINTFYGSYTPDNFKRMEEAGVEIVVTDLNKIKDANPIYSNLYRGYLHLIPTGKTGNLPNLFRPQDEGVSLGAYLSLLNFKANHRKVVISEKEAIVASANPHDGSSLHSNIAFKVNGAIIQDLVESEQAVVEFTTGKRIEDISVEVSDEGELEIQVITEGKIKSRILSEINSATRGDNIFIGAFYIGERDIIKALKEASKRGVNIRLVLDQNKDAFGVEKIGIPNKPVAKELNKSEYVQIKWYLTQGEQYHAKMFVHESNSEMTVIGGSANFTRRNINDLNLETDLAISGNKNSAQMIKISEYIERIWNNTDGHFTADYTQFRDESLLKYIVYIIQEITGLSTF